MRQEQAESSRLVWALAISLALHLLFGGGYYLGNKYHVWQTLHWPAWLKPLQTLVQRLQPKTSPPPVQPPPQREPPLMFVNVNPVQEVAEPPKQAKFYSNKNSRAANPEATQDSDTPKISGKQTEMVKTEDVPREKYLPLQPVQPTPPAPSTQPAQPPQPAPKPLTAQQEQPEQKPKAAQAPGDLAMAKPEPTPRTGEGQAPKPRPRKLAEVKARLPENQLPSMAMKQEGGVKRRLEIASLDAKATPFGAYDAALVEAISQRWFGLLDERQLAVDTRGKVVVQFVLHPDGRVTGVNVSENTTTEVQSFICQKAVTDPSPYATWPSDMRRMLGDTRSVQFTFYYY